MPPKKKVVTFIKAALQTGSTTPTPSVDTALGPHGVNIMESVKTYNAVTKSRRGNIIPAEITICEDRASTFIAKTLSATKLIEKAAGIQSGSDNPLKNRVGKLTGGQVYEIATMKLPDFSTSDVDAACKIVEDAVRSTGATAE